MPLAILSPAIALAVWRGEHSTAMPESWDSYLVMICHRTFPTLTAALAAATLSGCASEETASRFLVQPDRYVLYSCPELATASQANLTRQHELEALMAKAGSGS